jgi:predicted nucleotidyltransferase
MGQLDRKWDIMDIFFNFPNRNFYLRELARLSKLPKTTLERYLMVLLKEDLIKKEKKGPFYTYLAKETNFFYRYHKKNKLVEKIYKSDLVDFLEEKFYPQTIILFGSGAKGEYIKESDIDIFLLAKEKPVDLKMFEKKLKRKINLLFKENYSGLSKELFNNIINGYKLKGCIKLR